MANYRLAERKSDDLLKHLLDLRGVGEDEVEAFLNPDYDKHRHDPFLLNDMELAVERLLRAIKDDESVAIFSDYDCDGIPGAVVLHDFFKAVGFQNFKNYIPHRHYEGFGLSVEKVHEMNEGGAKVIVTIDCGTVDVAAARSAATLGVDLIITDHHEPKAELPKAVAVVNPRVGNSYPFPHLCGAGVVFKLVEALLERGDFDLKPGFEKWWLDMVALATVADMVPLVGENRVLVSYGLQVLRKSRRVGLQHLLRSARSNQRFLTEDDIGFTIGPRINAASRMDTPEEAFLMLVATDEGEAGTRVSRLEHLNNERKGMVAAMTKELKRHIAGMIEMPAVLVLGNPNWRPALVGLCANTLASEYNRPVFLWGRDGNGVIKGSCRSGGGISVVKLMEGCAEHFTEHGGHHSAGGFSVKENSIHHLSDSMNKINQELGASAVVEEEVEIDAGLRLEEVNNLLLSTLTKLAPYGTGNRKPLFAFSKIKPKKVDQFGKTREHLKLVLDGGLEAIAFFAKPEQFQNIPEIGKEITLLAHVEESYFMNRKQTRLRIVDIVFEVY